MSPKAKRSLNIGGEVRAAVERAQQPLPAYEDVLAVGSESSLSVAVPQRLALGDLRFLPEQQPRDMLGVEGWVRLQAERRNDPFGVLEALRESAKSREASQQVLDHVGELAQSIRSEGVLLPLSVVRLNGEYVVLDGHCRAMAAVLAEIPDVPVRLDDGGADGIGAELTVASHRFLLNWTQRRLTPLEGMREVVRIAGLATRVVLAEWGAQDLPADLAGALADSLDGEEHRHVTVQLEPGEDGLGESAGAEPTAEPNGSPVGEEGRRVTALLDGLELPGLEAGKLKPGQTKAGLLASAVRVLVLRKTGLSLDRYQTLYRLRRLHPEAQAQGAGLGESHLRAVLSAPRDLQPMLVKLMKLTSASVPETRAYCKVAREHGEGPLLEAFGKAMKRHEPKRRRTALSWEPFLRPLPEDLVLRLSALRAELEALPEGPRAERLRVVARQRAQYREALLVFDEILATYERQAEPDGADAETA